jgi:CheY-like chemotaxis protein
MVLLITQNEILAESIKKDLHQEGFQVEILLDFNSVIYTLHGNSAYQMLLIDFEGNEQKASNLCQRIKKDPFLRYIPLISIVNKDQVVKHLIAFELGVDEFIYVPYSTPELQLKMRSIQRLLELQKKLEKQENQLEALQQVQQILVTLSHYINNSLTPLYTLVQMMNDQNPTDTLRLKKIVRGTVEFISKVLTTLNNLVHTGEMKVIKEGVYKDLLLDIEEELNKLKKSSHISERVG